MAGVGPGEEGETWKVETLTMSEGGGVVCGDDDLPSASPSSLWIAPQSSFSAFWRLCDTSESPSEHRFSSWLSATIEALQLLRPMMSSSEVHRAAGTDRRTPIPVRSQVFLYLGAAVCEPSPPANNRSILALSCRFPIT